MKLATGAWAKVMVLAAATIRAMSMGNEPLELDPFGLFKEQSQDDGRAPYNPAVLQSLQDSGKFG